MSQFWIQRDNLRVNDDTMIQLWIRKMSKLRPKNAILGICSSVVLQVDGMVISSWCEV